MQGKYFLSHHGFLTGRQLKEVQYHTSWGYLYSSIEGARPTHLKHQLFSYARLR